MNKVVSVAEMQALEAAAATRGLPGPALMENAGRAVSDIIVQRCGLTSSRKALVLIGPGNNGGDGLVTARHLHDAGFVTVAYLINRPRADDAKLDLLVQRGVRLIQSHDDPGLLMLDSFLADSDVVVDGILGTGRARPIQGPLADVLDRVNDQSARYSIVAIDLPTGINADNGQADPHALSASLTVTLGQPKRGLMLGDAVDRVGELVVADIGIPAEIARNLPIDYPNAPSIARTLPRRPRASHKGLFGKVIAIVGSSLYTGAPVLAAQGAERVGAGLVTIACPQSVRDSIAMHTLESTFLPLPDDGRGEFGAGSIDLLKSVLADYVAVLIGPGIGRSEATAAFLSGVLPHLVGGSRPCVFDADALTLLSQLPRWWEHLPTNSILTPHPGEMSRLVGQRVDSDRITLARTHATSWGANVVLKGAHTIVAMPNGEAMVMPFANPALATAGTGDVLAGAILGFLAQGLSPKNAAEAGAFVHGVAGELLAERLGSEGGLAGDLARLLPSAMVAIRRSASRPLSRTG